MRRLADADRIRAFMDAVGRAAKVEIRLYFTGGATAVLSGWRSSTIDVGILLIPEDDQVYRSLPELKESLELNIELASPADLIPEVPGWQDRSPAIDRRGKVNYHHYDFYAQALAKIERGHAQDETDVQEMLRRGAIDRQRLMRHFEQIEPLLYRFPAIDPAFLEAGQESRPDPTSSRSPRDRTRAGSSRRTRRARSPRHESCKRRSRTRRCGTRSDDVKASRASCCRSRPVCRGSRELRSGPPARRRFRSGRRPPSH